MATKPHYTHRPMSVLQKAFYWVAATLLGWPAKQYFHLQLEGAENIPLGGGMILVCNHPSYLDGLLICLLISWWTQRIVQSVAKIELFRTLLAWPLAIQGAICIDRSEGRPALRHVVRVLREQRGIVLIFPEGTRSEGRAGRMTQDRLHSGAIVAAIQAEVPIIVLGIDGTDQAWPKGQRFIRRYRVTVRAGEPWHIPYKGNREDIPREFLDEQVVILASKMRALLPARLWPE